MTGNDRSTYVLEYLQGLELPATKIELVEQASENDAPEDVLDILQAIPDRSFSSVKDINKMLFLLEPLPDHGHLEASSAQDLSSEARLATERKMPPGGPGAS